MNNKIIETAVGQIEVRRNSRSKHVRLSIGRGGQLRLSLPWYASLAQGVRFAESKEQWIAMARERMQIRASQLPPVASEEQIEQLRAKAKVVLCQMCQQLSEQTGLKYAKVSVRVARTRWGSCSAQNNISLSVFLVRLPDELIRYVILHELCHTRHKNHSKQFHDMLNDLLEGREKEFIRKIRKYRPC